MRVRALWGAASVALVACNALTGIDTLGVGDEAYLPGDVSAEDADASFTSSDGGVRKDAGSAGDSASEDAGTFETSDAAPPVDAAVDTGPPPVEPCVPTSMGPRYGTDAQGLEWTNDNGILAPDNNVTHSNGNNSNPMVTTGYGFALPGNAEVKGIRVVIARNAIGSVSDNAITLSKGSPKANGAWPTGDLGGPYIQTTYGSSTDLWNTTWTAAEINAPSFGVSVKVNGSGDGHADSIGVTVYYCAP